MGLDPSPPPLLICVFDVIQFVFAGTDTSIDFEFEGKTKYDGALSRKVHTQNPLLRVIVGAHVVISTVSTPKPQSCNTIQHSEKRCNTHCNTDSNTKRPSLRVTVVFRVVISRVFSSSKSQSCNALQRTATHCHTHCNTLPHTLQRTAIQEGHYCAEQWFYAW